MKKAISKPLTRKQQATLAALAALPEDQIDTKDIPEVRDWSGAKRGLFYRPVKQQLTLRIDADIVAWFRAHGNGYQTSINRALREYVEFHERTRPFPELNNEPKGNARTIDVLRISAPKERLSSIPEKERVLFFLLGYAANQIIMFQKILLFASNSPADESVEGQVHGVQIEMLLRLMVGFVWETWTLIKKRFLEQPVGREYQSLLDNAGKRALSELKKQFGKSNLISTLRNNFAFHLPKTEEMEAAFKVAYNDANFDDTWNLYFSRDKFNSLYLLSDVVLIHAIFNSIGETDFAVGQRKIMKEVTAAANGMVEFIHAFTAALWKKHIAPHMDATVCAKIKNAPKIFEVQLPFFVELADKPRRSESNGSNPDSHGR